MTQGAFNSHLMAQQREFPELTQAQQGQNAFALTSEGLNTSYGIQNDTVLRHANQLHQGPKRDRITIALDNGASEEITAKEYRKRYGTKTHPKYPRPPASMGVASFGTLQGRFAAAAAALPVQTTFNFQQQLSPLPHPIPVLAEPQNNTRARRNDLATYPMNPLTSYAAAGFHEDDDSDDEVVCVPPPMATPVETPRASRVKRVATCLMGTIASSGETTSSPFHEGHWMAYEALVKKDEVATSVAQEMMVSTPVMAKILAARYKPRDN
jgi:hypothetical protein